MENTGSYHNTRIGQCSPYVCTVPSLGWCWCGKILDCISGTGLSSGCFDIVVVIAEDIVCHVESLALARFRGLISYTGRGCHRESNRHFRGEFCLEMARILENFVSKGFEKVFGKSD